MGLLPRARRATAGCRSMWTGLSTPFHVLHFRCCIPSLVSVLVLRRLPMLTEVQSCAYASRSFTATNADNARARLVTAPSNTIACKVSESARWGWNFQELSRVLVLEFEKLPRLCKNKLLERQVGDNEGGSAIASVSNGSRPKILRGTVLIIRSSSKMSICLSFERIQRKTMHVHLPFGWLQTWRTSPHINFSRIWDLQRGLALPRSILLRVASSQEKDYIERFRYALKKCH